MKIIGKHSSAYYQWGGGCDSWVLVDTPELSVKQEVLPVGSGEKLHYHSQARQFFYILSGTATFHVDGQQLSVTAQQGVYIPAGANHCISNLTDGKLEILVVSQPSTNEDRTNVEE